MDLSEGVYNGVLQKLALPIVRKVHLFKDVSEDALLLLAKYERVPSYRDVITQNEKPDKFCIIVSGDVAFLMTKTEEETEAVGALTSGDVFGHISALYNDPQAYTFKTISMTQLLMLKRAALLEIMLKKPEDAIMIIRNFVQFNLGVEHLPPDGSPSKPSDDRVEACISSVLPAAASTVKYGIPCISFFLEQFLSLDDGPVKTTLLNTAVKNGMENCVRLLILHGCEVDTGVVLHAMEAGHRRIFTLLYECGSFSNPKLGAAVLKRVAKTRDVCAFNELLQLGLGWDLCFSLYGKIEDDGGGFAYFMRCLDEHEGKGTNPRELAAQKALESTKNFPQMFRKCISRSSYKPEPIREKLKSTVGEMSAIR